MEDANHRRRLAAAARAAGGNGVGGAGQQLVVSWQQPLPLVPYSPLPPYPVYQQSPVLYSYPPPPPPPPYPLYWPVPTLPQLTPSHYPPVRIAEELPWLQQLIQSDRSVCEGVLVEVCGEVMGEGVRDMAREVVHSTINDIIFSYIGRQWARTPVKPRPPPHRPQPITSPLPMLPGQPSTDILPPVLEPAPTEPTSTAVENPYHELVIRSKNETELCQGLATLLMDQILFHHLLISDLDGGVAIATRTQSTHMLTEVLFNELLIKLITQNSSK